MNPFEFRKIILYGYSFDAPVGAPLLDGDGLPVKPLEHPVCFSAALWIPQRMPYQRGPRQSKTHAPQPFELDALEAGVIKEELMDFTFPRQPSPAEFARFLMPYWERLTVKALGHLPNKPPEDKDPKPRLVFEAVGS